MNILRKINFVLVTVLGIAAGIPKMMRVAAEVSFFESAGLGGNVIVVFGLLQIAGGILLVFRRTRLWGALLAAVMFLISSVMLLLSGNIAFGLLSLLPVLMAGIVIRDSARKQISVPA